MDIVNSVIAVVLVVTVFQIDEHSQIFATRCCNCSGRYSPKFIDVCIMCMLLCDERELFIMIMDSIWCLFKSTFVYCGDDQKWQV